MARSATEVTGTGPIYDLDGRQIVALSGGGAGDASAANQTSQIAQIGEVQASPTSNTVLDRLKTIATSVAAATPAGTALIGKVVAGLGTDTIYSGTTALTPKFAFVNVAASATDSSVVALVAAKKIRVLSAYAEAGATATDLTFQSNAAAISAKFANGANGGEVLPFSPVGWFETVAGEALKVTTGAGSSTGIGVVYVEV